MLLMNKYQLCLFFSEIFGRSTAASQYFLQLAGKALCWLFIGGFYFSVEPIRKSQLFIGHEVLQLKRATKSGAET